MVAPDDFLDEARQAYVAANRGTLTWMLDRPRQMGAFLDTKQNSITLADYGDGDHWRGPHYLYGWIQGRGLEALATHAAFFEREDAAFAARLDAAGRALYGALKALYDRYGAAFFVYDRTLRPVIPDAEGRLVPQVIGSDYFTYADAFVLKGLVAASSRYDPASRPAWLARLGALVAAIEGGRFIMDEMRPLDGTTAAAQQAEFGPRMIVLGAASLLARLGLAAGFGDRFIAHVLEHHWDRAGPEPSWLVRDAIGGDRCNVGHAMEFSGFALEYLPKQADLATIAAIERIIVAAFRRGFTPPGLCLHISARSGERLSPYFPWWSLPETIRAAALAYGRGGGADLLSVWQTAHRAFFAHYWRGTPPIAYQTRTLEGPVDYVPATPDLDPGYHTGLSFLGAIEAIDAIRH